MVDLTAFAAKGWCTLPYDADLHDWVNAVTPAARRSIAAPEMQHWLQCQGTWFVGVDALDNDETGQVGTSGPLRGAPVDAITALFGALPPLHRAQVSVTYPGFPKPRDEESDSAFRYRLKRYGAHVDGLLAVGPDRQRMIHEPHAFVLGLPINHFSANASPLMVWEGSHHIMGAALTEALKHHAPADWENVDLTAPYQAARREVFETCTAVPVHATPGESYLMHRHCLHGVAPWSCTETPPNDGRMIAYFRPELAGGIADWMQ